MAGKTQINTEMGNSRETVINAALMGENSGNIGNETVINPVVAGGTVIQAGQVLCDRYSVIRKMDVVTGEAELYLCENDNSQYVAKVYRRQVAIKPEISRKLMDIDSQYVAKIFETGEVDGYPVEIIPYYQYGSLQGRTFDYDYLKKRIIPSLNEGLKVLHSNGILHKDLKPSNIMVTDDQEDVAIIDFGISSTREMNHTVVVTKTGMTPEYSAPETFRNLFLEESDYYSLGITIYELFCGCTPYNNMDQEAIEQYISVQRIPFPDHMPDDLKNLIAACTYYDITNRRNKLNPNRRWTYEEVKRWCEGEEQMIPGEGIGTTKAGDINPYPFKGKVYVEIDKLVQALALNWEDGKKQLFRGLLSGFFKGCNPELAGYCIDAEQKAVWSVGRDDMIFWELLYKLNPGTTDFYWKGLVCQGLPALGREILEKLWADDRQSDACYCEILEKRVLSDYVAMKAEKNKQLSDAVRGLEDRYKMSDTRQDRTKSFYLMAYMLSGQKIMQLNGEEFQTVEELENYMKALLDESYEKFEELCQQLIDREDRLDVQFESWLLALGKKRELDAWRRQIHV